MRLHDVVVLTNDALMDLEFSSGGGVFVKDDVPVDPMILWLLTQTYRAHHNIPVAETKAAIAQPNS